MNCLFDAVSFIEPIDAAARIHQLLFARKKRMALRAYFDLHFLFDRTRGKRLAARACHRAFMVFGVYTFFHFTSPLFL